MTEEVTKLMDTLWFSMSDDARDNCRIVRYFHPGCDVCGEHTARILQFAPRPDVNLCAVCATRLTERIEAYRREVAESLVTRMSQEGPA